MSEHDIQKEVPPTPPGNSGAESACNRAARRFLDLWLRQVAIHAASGRVPPLPQVTAPDGTKRDDDDDDQPG